MDESDQHAAEARPGPPKAKRVPSNAAPDPRQVPDNSFGRQIALALIAAAGAGVGGLGIVTAVGGIVTEARFRGAGLPTELSVTVQSRGYLLAVGGEVLAVAVLFALALVAFVHWLPPFDDWSSRFRRLQSKPVRYRLFYSGLVILSLTDYAFWAGPLSGSQDLDFGWVLGLMLALALAGSWAATRFAMSARMAHKPDKPPLAEILRLLGVFGVLALLSASLATGASLAYPKVRPAAVLLLDNPPHVFCGVYVGQTSDRVYIGEAHQQPNNPDLGNHELGRVIELTRSHVGRLVIGTSLALSKAIAQRERLAQAMAVGTRASTCDAGSP